MIPIRRLQMKGNQGIYSFISGANYPDLYATDCHRPAFGAAFDPYGPSRLDSKESRIFRKILV
jgi:hypothetical protein